MTESERQERARLLRAWNSARRRLADGPTGESVGARLARLAAEGADAYDLTGWTDVYGNEDGIVGELERRTAAALGTEAAAFFPTGTMAQQAALRCWAERTGSGTVALHPLAHPVRWERDALRRLTGLSVVHPTEAPRLPTAAEVRDAAEPFGTLALELPLREAGFLLPSWDELTATVAAARERDAVVHFDGARIWECATHFGRGLPEIAALADTVYVSFYKSLGGLSGAALAGPEAVVEDAAAWRHRYGGQVFQQWPAALAALVGLERELPRLPEYVAHARTVAAALREALTESDVPWWLVWPREPHTHQFQVWLPYGVRELTEAGARQAEETGTLLFRRWSEPAGAPPGLAMHEVTVAAAGLTWSAGDVRDAVADFLGFLPRRSSSRTG
ncbi:L-threonine aldolase [Streptomyces sp. Amel2xB2]|uniref:threonine aldolase family protein n=1 Tax=Streptomyces sp. Amel2xB2 TaxID=1305829 RepID=UPI000DBAC063|nr:beta-eliminating lyase-related protein [Streptomyces sp. Amel2xB2]RAJ55468.1 L-threonine aldolase [Streptomyces sp. Amel2xB2]